MGARASFPTWANQLVQLGIPIKAHILPARLAARRVARVGDGRDWSIVRPSEGMVPDVKSDLSRTSFRTAQSAAKQLAELAGAGRA